MDATDLETFIAVAEANSFSRAAERLNLTQPAVTKRIQRLEDSLGTQLFDRIGRSVELTEGGRPIHAEASGFHLQLDPTALGTDKAAARRALEDALAALEAESND